METLLIDADYPAPDRLLAVLADAGCELRTDDALLELEQRASFGDGGGLGYRISGAHRLGPNR